MQTISIKILLFFYNLKMFIKGKYTKVTYDPGLELYIATEGNMKRYFKDRYRGLRQFRRGMQREKNQLFAAYCLEEVNFEPNDIVIDCGANYGNLFLSLSEKISEENYITFEPGPHEYFCLTHSIPNAKHTNQALADISGKRTFYLKSKTGDSSLVEPPDYVETVTVECTTLDDVFEKEGFNSVKLLKLEAEGYEPEILQGAKNSLGKIKFIAIDGGPERGLKEEETFTTLTNMLIKSGFVLIKVNHRNQYRAIFRNNSEGDPR